MAEKFHGGDRLQPTQPTNGSSPGKDLPSYGGTWVQTKNGPTVDGSEIRRSPVEVGVCKVLYIPGGCLGFLNHQQYESIGCSLDLLGTNKNPMNPYGQIILTENTTENPPHKVAFCKGNGTPYYTWRNIIPFGQIWCYIDLLAPLWADGFFYT